MACLNIMSVWGNGLDLTNLLENEKFYKSFKQVIQGQMSSLLIKYLNNDNI